MVNIPLKDMKKCYKCEIALTEKNKSVEHIIPNACGGKLKSDKLLCQACNSQLGSSYDSELSMQLNFLANFLNIKRDRGVPQDIKGVYIDSGDPAVIRPDGGHGLSRHVIIEEKHKNHIEIGIKSRNNKERERIISSLKKKYPNLDSDDISDNPSELIPSGPISFISSIPVGSKRAVLKSVINYFILIGGHREYIKHLLPYIEGATNLNVIYFFYPDEIIYNSPNTEVTNLIRIVGNPYEKILYAYVELFNVYNYLAILNDSYTGEPVDKMYCHDLLSNKEMTPNLDFTFGRSYLIEVFNAKNECKKQNFLNRMNRVISIAMDRHLIKNAEKAIIETLKENTLENGNFSCSDDEIFAKIESRISSLAVPHFSLEMLNEPPPENVEQRNKWLMDRRKQNEQDEGSH